MSVTRDIITPGPPPLRRSEALGYSGANYGKNLVWNGADLFLLYYLTDVAGVAPAVAGVMLLSTYIWGALADPVVGWFADRAPWRRSRFGPFLLIGSPICSLGFGLVFFPIPLAGHQHQLYLFGVILLFRTGYAICDSPHNALLGHVARSSDDRATIAATRYFFSAAGALTLGAVSYLLLSTDIASSKLAFWMFGMIAATLFAATMMIAWASTRRFDRPIARDQSSYIGGLKLASRLLRNGHILILFGAAILLSLGMPLIAKGIVFLSKYDQEIAISASTALMSLMVGQMLAMPLWVGVVRRSSKRMAFISASAVVAIAILACQFAEHRNMPTSVLSLLLLGVGIGGVNMLIWAMLPDLIDLVAWSERLELDGRLVGSFTLCLKVSAGLSTAFFSLCLVGVGYIPNGNQSTDSLVKLDWITATVPLCMSLACIALVHRYRIDDRTHRSVLRSLARRRARANEVSGVEGIERIPL